MSEYIAFGLTLLAAVCMALMVQGGWFKQHNVYACELVAVPIKESRP